MSARHDTSSTKFGFKMSQVWTPDRANSSFQWLRKTHRNDSVHYELRVPRMVVEMIEKRWTALEDMPRTMPASTLRLRRCHGF